MLFNTHDFGDFAQIMYWGSLNTARLPMPCTSDGGAQSAWAVHLQVLTYCLYAGGRAYGVCCPTLRQSGQRTPDPGNKTLSPKGFVLCRRGVVVESMQRGTQIAHTVHGSERKKILLTQKSRSTYISIYSNLHAHKKINVFIFHTDVKKIKKNNQKNLPKGNRKEWNLDQNGESVLDHPESI